MPALPRCPSCHLVHDIHQLVALQSLSERARELLSPGPQAFIGLRPPWAEGLDCRLQEHSWFVERCLLAPVRVQAELKLPQAEACC